MYYTIGEAAQRMHLSAPTLRYYDKEGLLPSWIAAQAALACSRNPTLNGSGLSNA